MKALSKLIIFLLLMAVFYMAGGQLEKQFSLYAQMDMSHRSVTYYSEQRYAAETASIRKAKSSEKMESSVADSLDQNSQKQSKAHKTVRYQMVYTYDSLSQELYSEKETVLDTLEADKTLPDSTKGEYQFLQLQWNDSGLAVETHIALSSTFGQLFADTFYTPMILRNGNRDDFEAGKLLEAVPDSSKQDSLYGELEDFFNRIAAHEVEEQGEVLVRKEYPKMHPSDIKVYPEIHTRFVTISPSLLRISKDSIYWIDQDSTIVETKLKSDIYIRR